MEWMQIGEVARRTGLTTRTLRHYDALGLLVPSGRSGGDYRQYTLEDVRRLLAIQHLKSLGLGLTEIGAALRNGLDPQTTLREHIDAVEERISAEQALLARLRGLLAASHDDWDDVLTAIELSERVRHPDGGVRFRAALESPDAITTDDLIGLLRDDPEPGVREAATWALVRRGGTAFDALIGHLADPDPGVRTQMAHALGKLRDPRAAGALTGLLADPVPEVAAKAAQALGSARRPRGSRRARGGAGSWVGVPARHDGDGPGGARRGRLRPGPRGPGGLGGDHPRGRRRSARLAGGHPGHRRAGRGHPR
jgi:DNA-binding transcriptional MerR regulator